MAQSLNARGFGLVAAVLCLPVVAFAMPNRKMNVPVFNATHPTSITRVQAGDAPVLRVDELFAERFGYQVPNPFSLSLPRQDANTIINVQLPDRVDDVYARISFSSLAAGEYETLDITPLRIGEGSSAQRRQTMSQLLITRVFADLTARYINKRLDGVNLYFMAGFDSVVLNGTYWDPKAGDIAVRIYAVMPKDDENGLLFYERRVVERAQGAERLAEAVVRSVVFD